MLIIDDDAEDALLLSEVIHELYPDVRCAVAHSSVEAKTLIGEQVPDYIFLDTMMYPVGGKETLIQLSQLTALSNTKIIMNSGVISPGLAGELLKLGADHVLQKPHDYSSMVSTIRQILDRPV